MVRYITFSNVHRLKCTLNKFTESGRQRKVQNIGEGKRISLDVGVRPPRFLKGAILFVDCIKEAVILSLYSVSVIGSR